MSVEEELLRAQLDQARAEVEQLGKYSDELFASANESQQQLAARERELADLRAEVFDLLVKHGAAQSKGPKRES